MTKSDTYPLHHIILLAKRLIAIPSTADKPEMLGKVLEVAKKELQGYFPMEEYVSNGIPSLLVHNTNKRTKHFKIILNAHLDVVPGKEEQYFAEEKDGKLYGRGAYDMKAAAAVMILLFKEIAAKVPYPLGLQISTDEELGSPHSTEYQIQKGVQADFVIVGECGTNLQIKNKGKGLLALKLTTKGKSAHGAYPWLGENAVLYMHKVIYDLQKKYPTPTVPVWESTVTVTKVETDNPVFNKIPDICRAYLDVRYVPEDKNTILENIKKTIHHRVSVEMLLHLTSHSTNQKNRYLDLLKNKATEITGQETTFVIGHGGSDMRLYPNGAVEFGPVGANQHADNEWVDSKSLEEYYHILKNFLLSVKP